ncbi:MAG TPA: hypothetical protein VHF89_04580 [Solirubrobacteraceae bacterium]|nr:hypothetical protein [Solirubrobacteraceae bacterium]
MPGRAAGEFEALGDAIACAAAGCGRLVAIRGSLLPDALSLAEEAGLAVHLARGSEAERAVPFGVARQLLLPPLDALEADERAEVLAGAARLAAPVLGPVPRGPRFGSALAVVHGLYWVTARLADRAPLALVVADAGWTDEPSRRLLRYLAQRIEEQPVALVVAA